MFNGDAGDKSGSRVSCEKAHAAVFEFIEVFYTRKRLHQTLEYVGPGQFEALHIP
jgi:hypothetical protein